VTHLGQALYFRGYVPGIITAVLVSLPYGLYLMKILSDRHITSPVTFVGLTLLRMALQVPLALLALAAATEL
jgi:hypothetical protein